MPRAAPRRAAGRRGAVRARPRAARRPREGRPGDLPHRRRVDRPGRPGAGDGARPAAARRHRRPARAAAPGRGRRAGPVRRADEDPPGGAGRADAPAGDPAVRGSAHAPVQPPLPVHAARRAGQRRAAPRAPAGGRDGRPGRLQGGQRPPRPRRRRRGAGRGGRGAAARRCAPRTCSAGSAARSSSRCCPTPAPAPPRRPASGCGPRWRPPTAPVAAHGERRLGRARRPTRRPTISSGGPIRRSTPPRTRAGTASAVLLLCLVAHDDDRRGKGRDHGQVRQGRARHRGHRGPDRAPDQPDQPPDRAPAGAQARPSLAPRAADARRSSPPLPELPPEEGPGRVPLARSASSACAGRRPRGRRRRGHARARLHARAVTRASRSRAPTCRAGPPCWSSTRSRSRRSAPTS